MRFVYAWFRAGVKLTAKDPIVCDFRSERIQERHVRGFYLQLSGIKQHPQIPRFLQIFRGIWPMPLSLLNHSALALFAQRTRIPTSARSIGFCATWVCISSSSS